MTSLTYWIQAVKFCGKLLPSGALSFSMAMIAVADVSLKTLLKLGRASNIPTVWTNVLAATVLAGAMQPGWRICLVLLAASLYYFGGMFLNDYFDRTIDGSERPERPIPAGEISATTVAKIGFGFLFAGTLTLLPVGAPAAAFGLLLSGTIIGYDLHHKNNVAAPVVMGSCRALVYCMSAAAEGGVSIIVVIAAVALLLYVAGVTYAARLEAFDRLGSLWPLALLAMPLVVGLPVLMMGVSAAAIYVLLAGWTAAAVSLLARRPVAGAVSQAVGRLIAGISLVDATFLAGAGAIAYALVAIVGFVLTLALHKRIAGT
jgi:4-hydroxybenzoate polyprenyltransferase